MNAGELALHRKNTAWFIKDKPTSIELVPRTKVETPSGGERYEDQPPRGAQTFRIVELGQRNTPAVISTEDGSQYNAEYWLVGAHDAEIEYLDYWKMEGHTWFVGEVLRSNGYEVRALVADRGPRG